MSYLEMTAVGVFMADEGNSFFCE